jgi:proteasome lid subunit RPN8/RPN11
MDCWNCGVYEQLLKDRPVVESGSSKRFKVSEETESIKNELEISSIGAFIWSPGENAAFSVHPTEINNDIQETIESMSLDTERREKRIKPADTAIKQLFRDLKQGTSKPHSLMTPFTYGEVGKPSETQPFRVVVHPQVSLVCDLHCHITDAEIIGILAGRWDRENSVLYIQAAIPCSSSNSGATDVELDSEAEYWAHQRVSDFGLSLVGWYHSHPRFEANPSLIDVQNQLIRQGTFKDETSGKEPFVGLIISTYDKVLLDGKSSHKWFASKEYEENGAKTGVVMAVQIEAEVFDYNIKDSMNQSRIGKNFTETEVLEMKPSLKEYHETFRSLSEKSSISNSILSPKPTVPTTSESTDPPVPTVKFEEPVVVKPEPVFQLENPVLSETRKEENSSQSSFSPVRRSQRVSKPKNDDMYFFEETTSPRSAKLGKFPEQSLSPTPIAPLTSAGKKKTTKRKNSELAVTYEIVEETQPTKSEPPPPPEQASLYSSFVLSVQHTQLQSSLIARKIICCTPPFLRFPAVCALTIGFHFSRNRLRLKLSAPWSGKTKVDKLYLSVSRWINYFRDENNHVHSAGVDLLNNIIEFYKCCWEEYSKDTGKTCKRKGEAKEKG